jgi:probable phosphoglycerate mutase
VIILARHGQTAANAGGLLQGRTDRPLSELGRRQAGALAAALAAGPVSRDVRRVVASPLPRAIETATPIAAALGVEVHVEPALVELDYGDWEGRALADVDAAEWARWRADPSFAPPGGESLQAVRARVEAWLEAEVGRDDPVIAVSHVSPIKAAVCSALGVDDGVSWNLHLEVASVTRLLRRGSRFALGAFNETPAAGIDVRDWP